MGILMDLINSDRVALQIESDMLQKRLLNNVIEEEYCLTNKLIIIKNKSNRHWNRRLKNKGR